MGIITKMRERAAENARIKAEIRVMIAKLDATFERWKLTDPEMEQNRLAIESSIRGAKEALGIKQH